MRRMTVLFCTLLALAGCKRQGSTDIASPDPRAIGNPGHGAELVNSYGCGSCHTISGVPNADGVVGPPLNDFAHRVYIAGMLHNNPTNLIRWIQYPQAVIPGNVMPDMGIGKTDAHDIAAFLYTRK